MTDVRRWIWLGVALLVAVLLYSLHNILTPFLIGILLAYLADPLVDRLERLGLSRTWGVIVVFGLFTLLLLALLLVLVPLLAKQLVRLYELAPQMLDWLEHVALPWVQSRLGLADGFGNSTGSRLPSAATWARLPTWSACCCRMPQLQAWR